LIYVSAKVQMLNKTKKRLISLGKKRELITELCSTATMVGMVLLIRKTKLPNNKSMIDIR